MYKIKTKKKIIQSTTTQNKLDDMDSHALETQLKEFDQEHLMQFYDKLDDDQQLKFTNELKGVDFKQITRLYTKAKQDLESPAVSFPSSKLIDIIIYYLYQ